MASIDILHLRDDLLLFVDILVETKNFQTIGAEEGLQFSRAQLEERFQPCLCLGRRRFGFSVCVGSAGRGACAGVGFIFKACAFLRRRAASRHVVTVNRRR